MLPTYVDICGSPVKISNVVQELRVYIDSNLTFSHHLSRISASSFAYLRLISRLRLCLNFQSRFVLIHSLVLSRINFCDSLLHGTSKKASNCLQRILNSAMRLALGRKKRDSVSDDMKRIGWLPFKQLAAHRLLCLIHRVITTGRPAYLSNLLTFSSSARELRSSNNLLLVVPRVSTTAGDRAFSRAAAQLWNSIPTEIRRIDNLKVFRSMTYRHLFRVAYEDCTAVCSD
jgi:hypothetical protein